MAGQLDPHSFVRWTQSYVMRRSVALLPAGMLGDWKERETFWPDTAQGFMKRLGQMREWIALQANRDFRKRIVSGGEVMKKGLNLKTDVGQIAGFTFVIDR